MRISDWSSDVCSSDLVGLAAIIIGRNYVMGTAGRMGPAYFPTVLGGVLALIGLAAVIRSFFPAGEAIGKFAVKETLLIISALLVFGFLICGAGVARTRVVEGKSGDDCGDSGGG